MSTPRRSRLVLLPLPALALVALLATTVTAHEFWIEPATFKPVPHKVVAIGLRVGERFLGEPVSRDAARIERFTLTGPEGERPIVGLDGSSPAGAVRVDGPGLYVAAYRTKRTPHTLEAEEFEAYLREEGLEAAIDVRERRGTRKEPGREVYSRCAKSLLLVGAPEGGGAGFDKAIGLRLEIVPELNPYALRAGATLPFTVIFDGAPLEGVVVVAVERAAPARMVKARTDAKGRVSLALDRPGEWLVTTIHMVEAPPETGADWESLWASLTFPLEAAAEQAAARSPGG